MLRAPREVQCHRGSPLSYHGLNSLPRLSLVGCFWVCDCPYLLCLTFICIVFKNTFYLVWQWLEFKSLAWKSDITFVSISQAMEWRRGTIVGLPLGHQFAFIWTCIFSFWKWCRKEGRLTPLMPPCCALQLTPPQLFCSQAEPPVSCVMRP